MRFIDEATIRIEAGHGGPGSVSFRREKYVPRGGPDGGDGGKGGDVIFRVNVQLSTLQDFRYKREFKAERGNHGSGANKTGRSGDDIIVEVPLGTVIRDAETGDIIIDMNEPGQEWLAAKGGRGGKGNAHFVSSTFQAPKFAQPGEPGEERSIKLELKLLADVAIIGYPNAGKSTLISRISAARPKIADYAFTTLTPNLGVVAFDENESCVVADIPGLIEGAHRGAGLGTKFLKHIERCHLFIHLLDGTRLLDVATQPDYDKMMKGENQDEASSENPLTVEAVVEELIHNYKAIRSELGLFNEALLHKPELVVLNKADLFQSDPAIIEQGRKALRQQLNSIRGVPPHRDEPLAVSGVSGSGIEQLLNVVRELLNESRGSRAEGRRKGPRPDKSAVRLPHELLGDEDEDSN